VYLESVVDHGSDPDRFLTMDSTTGKVTYRTGTEVASDIGAVDTDTTYSAGTNISLAGTTFNVDDAFLKNDASDSTSGDLTAANFSTAGFVETIEVLSRGDLTLSIDNNNSSTGDKFIFQANNTTEVASIDDRGNLQLDGSITAKQRGVFNQSFHDDLGTTKHYLPWSGTLEQSANPYQEEVAMVAPCSGRIVSCTVRTNSITGSGDMTIGIHTREAGALVGSGWVDEEAETLAVTSTDDNHAFHFVFDNDKHFEAGELIVMSIGNSADLSGYTYWYISTVVEWNWNELLGTTSGEHD
jgi:hypothetical protein